MIAVMADERFLKVPDVAKRLNVSEYTVREWLRTGRLAGYRPGGTKAGWRVSEADLDACLKSVRRPEVGHE